MSDVNSIVETYEYVEAQGKSWKMQHVTPGVRGKFSAILKMRADTAAREAKAFGEVAYREHVAILIEQKAAGAYSWGSPLDPEGYGSAVSAFLATEEGKYVLIGLLLEKKHGEIPPKELCELIRSNVDGFGEATTACLRQGKPLPKTDTDEEPDPNATTPEKPAA